VSTELRSPDPTLDSLAPGHIVEFITADVHGEPAEAHQINSRHASGPMIPANDARWFAIPCQECFPDAPPPGYTDDCGCYTHVDGPCDPGLSWQTPTAAEDAQV